MKQRLTIGTRGSKLALAQTESVAERIRAANPDLEVNVIQIKTAGDIDQKAPLGSTGVGVFVKELEEALLDNRIDAAVHSLKDMPSELPDGLALAAVLERLYPGDVLISGSGKKLANLPAGAKIGTGSIRRAAQLKAYRPDIEVVSIRGNVDTRINKALSGELDGVILAAAGLKRLGWDDKITEYLPLGHFLPPPGQGALAIETRSADAATLKLITPLEHTPTRHCITAERAFLRKLAGGCRAPIAGLAVLSRDSLKIEGMVIDVKTGRNIRHSETGNPAIAERLGTALADKLLAEGAAKLLENQEDA